MVGRGGEVLVRPGAGRVGLDCQRLPHRPPHRHGRTGDGRVRPDGEDLATEVLQGDVHGGRTGLGRGPGERELVEVLDARRDRTRASLRRLEDELARRRLGCLVEAVADPGRRLGLRHLAGLVDLEDEHDVRLDACARGLGRILGVLEVSQAGRRQRRARRRRRGRLVGLRGDRGAGGAADASALGKRRARVRRGPEREQEERRASRRQGSAQGVRLSCRSPRCHTGTDALEQSSAEGNHRRACAQRAAQPGGAATGSLSLSPGPPLRRTCGPSRSGGSGRTRARGGAPRGGGSSARGVPVSVA